MRHTIRGVGALLACASLQPFMIAPAAHAQDAEADTEREVIVVTARRREETLQDTPVAVTAFSPQQLENLGAQDITALTQFTPNITLEVSRATNTTLTAFIRGVGQQDPVAGFEQGVGIYLDDVYLNRPQAAVLDIYDLERIEVLRGPQGTLYGRNTIGGAVKYVTKRIDPDTPTATVTGALGNFGQRDAILTASTPVTDTFRVGGSIARFRRNGFGENRFTGEENYDKNIFAARASAEFEPTSDWFFRLSGDYIIDTSEARHGFRLFPSDVTGAEVLGDIFDTEAGVRDFAPFDDNRVEAFGVQANAEWTVNDWLTLKSITAYRQDDTDSLIDFDSTPAPTFDAWVVYQNDQFSQELQALFTGDRWNAVAGFYYLDANAFNAFDVFLSTVTSFTLGDVDTQAWAVFGEGTYDITDRLSLTVGGRFTEDERDARITRELFLGQASPFFGNSDAVSLTPPVLVDGEEVVPTFVGNRTDDAFNPRVILAWDATDDINLYASYSQGFKGGLFDPRGAFDTEEVRNGVEPEFVDSYEIGMKGAFLNNRLLANTAIFFADYTDVQIPGSVIITNPDGSTDFVGTLTNAGAAEIFGIEFEGTAYLTDKLTAFGSVGYLDADYTEFVLEGVDVSDERDVQNAPNWSGSITFDYTTPLEMPALGEGDVSLTSSASYRGDVQQFEFAIPEIDQEAFWLLDASLVWRSQDNRVSAAFNARNLTNEEYIVSGYNFPTVDNSILAFFGNPRTYTGSITLRY